MLALTFSVYASSTTLYLTSESLVFRYKWIGLLYLGTGIVGNRVSESSSCERFVFSCDKATMSTWRQGAYGAAVSAASEKQLGSNCWVMVWIVQTEGMAIAVSWIPSGYLWRSASLLWILFAFVEIYWRWRLNIYQLEPSSEIDNEVQSYRG